MKDDYKVDDQWDVATRKAIQVGRQGWHSSVPPNGHANRAAAENLKHNDNPLGLDTPENEIETTPEHRNLVAGDPSCAGWTRKFDDPNVVQLREKLKRLNGIRGLEIVSPTEVERAAELFHRDGFVVVADAIEPKQLKRIRAAADRAIDEMLAVDPDCSVGGGAGDCPIVIRLAAVRHRVTCCTATSGSSSLICRRRRPYSAQFSVHPITS